MWSRMGGGARRSKSKKCASGVVAHSKPRILPPSNQATSGQRRIMLPTFLLLLIASAVHGFVATAGVNRPLQRCHVPVMQEPMGFRPDSEATSSSVWPNGLDNDAVHVFNVGDSGKPLKMALTQVSDEKRAQLAFWRFMYEHEAGNDDPSQLARVQAELRAQMALAASAGAAGVTCGAYLNGVDGDEHAIALVRFESPDDSADDDGAGGGKVMIIDTVLVTPVGVPPQMRAPLKDAVVASLRAIGEANKMTVRMWSDYDA